MKLFAKYQRKIAKDRYKRYRIFFFISLAVFVLSFFIKLLLIPKVFEYNSIQNSFLSIFAKVITFEFAFYFAEFVFGITLYAPFLQIAFSVIKGYISGFIVISAFGIGAYSIKHKIIMILYFCISAILFSAYSSFCTQVSVRLYSDGITYSIRKEENRMFGGSLFNSRFFCNTVNMRFMFSYFSVFFGAYIFQTAFSALFAMIIT